MTSRMALTTGCWPHLSMLVANSCESEGGFLVVPNPVIDARAVALRIFYLLVRDQEVGGSNSLAPGSHNRYMKCCLA